MDPRFTEFVRRLIHHSIHAAIHSFFWKLPLFWVAVILAILVGSVVFFRLY